MQEFQVNLKLEGQVATLAMTGDLTHNSETRLFNAYEKVVSARAHYIILDFRKTEYINSAGMSVIITLLTRAQQAGQEMRAFGLSSHYQKIFEMVGLLKYIQHFHSPEAAYQGLPKSF